MDALGATALKRRRRTRAAETIILAKKGFAEPQVFRLGDGDLAKDGVSVLSRCSGDVALGDDGTEATAVGWQRVVAGGGSGVDEAAVVGTLELSL